MSDLVANILFSSLLIQYSIGLILLSYVKTKLEFIICLVPLGFYCVLVKETLKDFLINFPTIINKFKCYWSNLK